MAARQDLDSRPSNLPAHLTGRLHDRVIGPDAGLETTWVSMTNARRRLAVIDEHGRLLGLLCHKRTGRGFRANERRTLTR